MAENSNVIFRLPRGIIDKIRNEQVNFVFFLALQQNYNLSLVINIKLFYVKLIFQFKKLLLLRDISKCERYFVKVGSSHV